MVVGGDPRPDVSSFQAGFGDVPAKGRGQHRPDDNHLIHTKVYHPNLKFWTLGLQLYLRFEGGTGGPGAMFGSSHTEPEEVRLEV